MEGPVAVLPFGKLQVYEVFVSGFVMVWVMLLVPTEVVKLVSQLLGGVLFTQKESQAVPVHPITGSVIVTQA
jgi:hypothetical protein